jgi:hypothetical protein
VNNKEASGAALLDLAGGFGENQTLTANAKNTDT